MILLLNTEVKELIRQKKNGRLSKTTGHRYVCNDDYPALEVVAKMRGYDSLNEFYWKCVENPNYK